MCTLQVTLTVAGLVSGGELDWFLMCTSGDTDWTALFQVVSWLVFNVLSSGDTDCGLSCFSQ